MKKSRFLLGALVAAGYGGTAAAQSLDPPVAVDINPDPEIVEVNLVAAETTWEYLPGVETTVYAYNGTVPGPTIEANLGDTVIVHFTNDLPEPTTIHWHGLEIPAAMDGSHVSQPWVPPGGTFDYEFEVLRDALYWYHPHVRTFDQVEKGLYGLVVVRDPVLEANLGLDQIEEHLIVFDDVLLDANDQVVPAFSFTDPAENALYHVNGRVGNHLLLNGKVVSSVPPLGVANGEPIRLRVLNAANSTFCRLDINDFGVQLWELGTDAGFQRNPFPLLEVTVTGPAEHPGQALLGEMGQGVLLMPGERRDVVFTPIGEDEEVFTIHQNDWFRGRHNATVVGGQVMLGDDPMDGFYPPQDFLQIELQGPDPGTGEYQPPSFLRSLPDAQPEEGILPVTFGHGNPDPLGNVILFAQAEFVGGMMNPLPTPKVDSFKAHDVEVGDTWIWEVTNLSHGDHPFHIHGFFFELVEYEFQDDLDPKNPDLNFSFQPQRRFLKDTIRIPARLGAKGTSRTIARLRTTFTDKGREGLVTAEGTTPTFDIDGNYTSGGWLFHCHVLEHSGKGMLSFYELRDPSLSPFSLLGKELAGSLGKVSLTARGNLLPATPVRFDLVNAVPGAPVALVIGNSVQNVPYEGGTIVPSFGEILTGTADANGELTLVYDGWEAEPPGTEFYAQGVILDPPGFIPVLPGAGSGSSRAAPLVGTPSGKLVEVREGGVALSNAITFTRP